MEVPNGSKRRIQLLDEVIRMPVVLGEEAEGYCGDWVVAPGAVQAAEQVLALLRRKVQQLGVPLTPHPQTHLGPMEGRSLRGGKLGPWEQLGCQLSTRLCLVAQLGTSCHKGNADSSSSDPVITSGPHRATWWWQ